MSFNNETHTLRTVHGVIRHEAFAIAGLNSDDVIKSDVTQITKHFCLVEKSVLVSFDNEKAIH